MAGSPRRRSSSPRSRRLSPTRRRSPSPRSRRLSPRHSRRSPKSIAEDWLRRVPPPQYEPEPKMFQKFDYAKTMEEQKKDYENFLRIRRSNKEKSDKYRNEFISEVQNEIDFENAAEEERKKSPKRSRRVRRRSVSPRRRA